MKNLVNNNNRFKFALTEEQKSKRTLDQIVASTRGDKPSMIAVAIAVISVKRQQNPGVYHPVSHFNIDGMVHI